MVRAGTLALTVMCPRGFTVAQALSEHGSMEVKQIVQVLQVVRLGVAMAFSDVSRICSLYEAEAAWSTQEIQSHRNSTSPRQQPPMYVYNQPTSLESGCKGFKTRWVWGGLGGLRGLVHVLWCCVCLPGARISWSLTRFIHCSH